MEAIKQKNLLSAEIKALEERLQTLPDNQVDERVEIRKKLIRKLIENEQITKKQPS